MICIDWDVVKYSLEVRAHCDGSRIIATYKTNDPNPPELALYDKVGESKYYFAEEKKKISTGIGTVGFEVKDTYTPRVCIAPYRHDYETEDYLKRYMWSYSKLKINDIHGESSMDGITLKIRGVWLSSMLGRPAISFSYALEGDKISRAVLKICQGNYCEELPVFRNEGAITVMMIKSPLCVELVNVSKGGSLFGIW